ncbi:MAG: hypothetical protein E7422_04775 [Ruminococcaceae bacterium]|nr:hypothetical protein [Oscillospiraceae bacterium]
MIQAYRPAYDVSIDYDGDGNYSLSDSEDNDLYSGEYHAGETVTLALEPDGGLLGVVTGAYLLEENEPTETAVVLTQNESNPNVYTFTMPAGDVIVYVKFVTAALTNGKAYAPAGATLLLATYEGGRMTGAQSVTLNAVSVGKTLAQLGLTVPASGHYKVFLVDGNYAPLCAAFDNENP